MATEPGFDPWTIFFSIAAGCGFCFAVWLFFSNKQHRAFRYLAGILLLFALLLSEWILWWTGYIQRVPQLRAFSYAFPMFLGVWLLGYYRAAFAGNTKAGEGTAVVSWRHYLPGFLFVLKLLPVYLWGFGIRVYDWNSLTYVGYLDVAFYVLLLHFAACPIWIYREFKPQFSPDPELGRWHRCILGAYGGIVLAYVVHHIIGLLGYMNPRLDFLIAFFITLFMSLVGWLGIAQPRILAGEVLLEAIFPKKYLKSALDAAAAASLAERIRQVFEQEKIYLDADLTLDSLARQLNSTRHHVSQVVNSVYGVGFSEWVTQWRIEEARTLLEHKGPEAPIIKEVAYRSGFNTKAAFNLAFKKHTGMTPKAYRLNV